MHEIHGSGVATDVRVAVIVAQFNDEITGGLLRGALTALTERGVADEAVTVVRVPGAFELPLAAQMAADTGRFDAMVCLGCLIKGDTMHFEYIATAATNGIAEAAVATGIPMGFGLLTTLTDAQAEVRSQPGPGNKGREAALAALEMVQISRRLAEGNKDASR